MTDPETATRGRQQLQAWVEAEPTRNQTTLAELLEVKQPTVSAWLRGRARPDALQRELIEARTGVPTDAWFTAEELEAVRRARRCRARSTRTLTDG